MTRQRRNYLIAAKISCAVAAAGLALAITGAYHMAAQTAAPALIHQDYTQAFDSVTFQGKVADEWHFWLKVRRANMHDHEPRGFDPSYTAVFSEYKPMVRKLANGTWEIQFTSEIAEGIP